MQLKSFLGICLLCGALSTGYGQVLVSGTIIDSNRSQVVLFEPISGFYNDELAGPEGLVSLDENGHFERSIPLQQPMMLCLRIGLRPIHFFAEPGDTISMAIDVNKFTDYDANGGIAFTGKNAAGNIYFNEFNFNPGRKIGRFKAIVEDSLRLWQNFKFETIDYGLSQITSGFDTLLSKGEITKGFYDLIVPGIKSTLVSQIIRDLFVVRHDILFSNAVSLADQIFDKYPISEYIIKKSPFGRTTASYFFLTKASQYYPTYHLADSMVAVNGQKLFVNSNLVKWLFAPEEIQEVFWPITLIRLKSLFADSYGKRDVETFLALHPNSPVRRYLHPPWFSDNELASTEVDSSLIHFISDSALEKFEDLIQQRFVGKKVFVDFWASWCVPCKQEFAFNAQVDSFCNENNIQKLFLSFDFPENQNDMVRNIYAYNLKGYHVQVNEKLFKDLASIFFPDGEISLPRYVLINDKGHIVNESAPRPSSGNSLLQAMKAGFNLPD